MHVRCLEASTCCCYSIRAQDCQRSVWNWGHCMAPATNTPLIFRCWNKPQHFVLIKTSLEVTRHVGLTANTWMRTATNRHKITWKSKTKVSLQKNLREGQNFQCPKPTSNCLCQNIISVSCPCINNLTNLNRILLLFTILCSVRLPHIKTLFPLSNSAFLDKSKGKYEFTRQEFDVDPQWARVTFARHLIA